MNKAKAIAAVLMLCASSAVSYLAGYNQGCTKHYEVACRMSDLIRHYQDDLRDTVELGLEDYGDFDELCYIYLWDDGIGEPVNLDDYVWCY